MNDIICFVDFGVLNHKVLLPDGSIVEVPKEDLPKLLISYAHNFSSNNIKIVGHPDYACRFISKIKEEENRLFEKNSIEIEIIGGANHE